MDDDDADCSHTADYWSVYYQLFVNDSQAALVRAQAKKLCLLSTSMGKWNDGAYGKVIRFCDEGTLDLVRELWSLYSTERSRKQRFRFEKSFKEEIRKIKKSRDQMYSTSTTPIHTSSLRSAAPASLGGAVNDLNELGNEFWEDGSLVQGKCASSKQIRANPLFTSPDPAAKLHYGIDSLAGFHLATAYVPLITDKSQSDPSQGGSSKARVVTAARAEFDAWMNSFRRRVDAGITLRFFVGDAIAFAHTLQCQRVKGQANFAHWYRAREGFDPLILDGPDYGPHGSAPLSFTVIDTSNLADHIGAINVLVATSPLLANSMSATLYTESLVKQAKTHKEYAESMLCGDLTTMSTLLGLVPVDYWTNTSPISPVNEVLPGSASWSSEEGATQSFIRLAWKRPPTHNTGHSSPPLLQTLHFDALGLARVLYRAYVQMFETERLDWQLSNIGLIGVRRMRFPTYHRVSFAALLKFVKTRVAVDWEVVTELLFLKISENNSNIMGGHYMQELMLYCQLFEVRTESVFQVHSLVQEAVNRFPPNVLFGDLRDWRNLPEWLCVTLRVPRARLSVFTESEFSGVGAHPVHCLIERSDALRIGGWKNIFAAVQVGFGQISTSGTRYTDSFKICVCEDRNGWHGSSSLVVSFRAPTWMLMDLDDAQVAFGLSSTTFTDLRFMERLGLMMTIFEANLSDKDHVFFSKDLPKQTGVTCVPGLANTDLACPEDVNPGATTTLKAEVDVQEARISALTTRLEMLSPEFKCQLSSGNPVRCSPFPLNFNFTLAIPSVPLLKADFPTPASLSGLKMRIARKSSWIEVVAPVAAKVAARTTIQDQPCAYPVHQNASGGSAPPLVWYLPYVDLSVLPRIDTSRPGSLGWFAPQVGSMLSARDHAALGSSTPRLAFKRSLLTILLRAAGPASSTSGRPSSVFALVTGVEKNNNNNNNNNTMTQKIILVVLVSDVRLDLANRTVLLDAAVLVPHDGLSLPPAALSWLGAAQEDGGGCRIRISDAEAQAWKALLPAFVERCRTWEHRAGCEYAGAERVVPLSVRRGEACLCRCGSGVLPEGFFPARVAGDRTGPGWESIKKELVRAALSPCFFCPLVDDLPGPIFGGGGDGAVRVSNIVGECRACGRTLRERGEKLSFCAACQSVEYCSRKCQVTDWSRHKVECNQQE